MVGRSGEGAPAIVLNRLFTCPAVPAPHLLPPLPEHAPLLPCPPSQPNLHPHTHAASVDFFHRHHFTLPPFAPALSREFAPYKPNPASLLHIAEKWGVAPGELVMIGDSAKDDVRGVGLNEDGWGG